MTGEGKTKISGSVSKVTVDMKRIVSRFDIENTTTRSNLTVQTVTVAQGRINGALWNSPHTPVTKEELKTSPLLTTYREVDFAIIKGANKGMTESVIYAYPSEASDNAYLIIKGTYKSPVNSEQVPVTYNIPIVRTPEGSDEGLPIALKANSRYKLRITDVTQSNIFATFEVVDWTSGGGINLKPDNDAPLFDPATAFIEGDQPKDLNALKPEATTHDYEVKTDKDGNGGFKIIIAATGKVRAEKEPLVKNNTRASLDDWFSIAVPTVEEKDGVWYSTFNVNYYSAVGQQPVAVHFINEAASYDPALWTTVNFYGPKEVPLFAVVAGGNSTGNVTNADDKKVPTASLYRIANSYVEFDITCIEGINVSSVATGYDAKEVKVSGYTHTYRISVTDAATAVDGEIVFQNSGDTSKSTTVAITALDPSLKYTTVATDAAVTWTEGTETPFVTTGKLKVDLDALVKYDFKIEAAGNLTATNLSNCTWLKITQTHAWANNDGERYVQYSIEKTDALPSATDDVTLKFTNNLTENLKEIVAPDLSITVHKDYSKPKLSAGTTTGSQSDFNQGLTTGFPGTGAASSIEMYKAKGSKMTVTMDCGTEAAAFDAVNGLSFTQIGSTKEYIIEVTDAAQIAGNTSNLIVYNTAAKTADASTDRKAELNITWKDPAITFALKTGEDGGGKAVISSDIVNVSDYDGLGEYDPISITVTGYKDSGISYTGNETTWLNNTVKPDKIGADGTATITFLKNGAGNGSSNDDIVITITNAIANGGNKTITLKKVVVP